MRSIALAIAVAGLTGCATTADTTAMASSTGIPQSQLDAYCKDITCNFDKLKKRTEVTGNDYSIMKSMSGAESRTLEFTWVTGNKEVRARAFVADLYKSVNPSDAEIYIGGDQVVVLSDKASNKLGYYNDVAGSYERIGVVEDWISPELAMKIASAPYDQVTIRFNGSDGYVDVQMPREHNLKSVAAIALAAQP